MRRILLFLAAVFASTLAEDRLVSRRLRVNSRLGRRGVTPPEFFNVTFVHVNDVHSHLDEYMTSGTDCNESTSSSCVGGYARLKTKMNEIRETTDRSLVLNMGDEFQGTLFFSYYGGEKIAETVNSIGFDAMTIGNHEFDRGNDHLADYLANMTAPVISANIRTNNTKLAAQIKPYHIIPEHSMALIGMTTIHTKTTSSPDPGTEFLDPVKVLQDTVDYINEYEDVERIVAMTHIGYTEDMDLARRTRGVHLILGGHSHTLLGDFEQAEGPYPTIATNLDGEEVFIVTAWRWGQVLGYINVSFEAGAPGRVLEYSGGPIYMDKTTKQDPELQAKVDSWRQPFDDYAREVVGFIREDLDATKCQKGECTLGNFISDAILDYRLSLGAKVDGAIMNSGGIRATIPAGNVTRGEIITSFPFGNAVVDLDFTGLELWTMFSGIVNKINSAHREVTSFIQISRTISMVYAPSQPVGQRLRSLSFSGKPVHFNQKYVISTIDFVAGGGDGFIYPPKKTGPPMNSLDVVLADYVTAMSPFTPSLDGRIRKVKGIGMELYNGGEGGQAVVAEKSCFGASCLREV